MKLVQVDMLISAGPWPTSAEWRTVQAEIEAAVEAVKWPPGTDRFIVYPDTGKGRREGNGVGPIKEACMLALRNFGWSTDERRNALRMDAVKALADGRVFALEWETGNISSSHRAINRLLLGHLQGLVRGGALVVPTGAMYKYLTDRVGNLPELRPYYPLWKTYRWDNGVLAVVAVEHDGTSEEVPRIAKGTNGRALV